MIKIIPATQELVDRLVVPAALADNAQGVFNATQIIIKEKEVVGYLSIGAVPTVMCWLHRTKLKGRDSLAINTFIENHINATLGCDVVIFPCPRTSPLYPFLSRVGYEECVGDVVFIKNLKQNANSLK